jgi:tetratricopeptide (TPR) repeat protein
MRLGERLWAARIALAEAVAHHRAGCLPAVRALLEEQWRQAELVPQLETQIVAHLGLVELESGHLDRAIGLLHRALELAELRGERHTVWDVRLNLALADYLRGRWLEARQGFERVLVEAEAESPNHVVLALINLVDVFLALGDVEAGVHVLDRLAGDPSVREAAHYAAELETLKLAVALARGDDASIAAYARAVDAAPGLFGYRRVELLGRACVARGDTERAAAALADLEARAAVAGIDSGDAPVLLAAARLRQLIDATTSVNPRRATT